MKKIFSPAQIRSWEKRTMENRNISSLELMEKAASAFVKEFCRRFPKKLKIGILAGSGNNGGDALAIGRMLAQKHRNVRVLFLPGEKISPDCKTNLEKAFFVRSLKTANELCESEDREIWIDGIFGTGISRPPKDLSAEVIDRVNQMSGIKVAIDVPSGLYSDRILDHSHVFRADSVFTFEAPKLSFLWPSSGKFMSDWVCLPIGLDKEVMESIPSEFRLLEKTDVEFLPTARPKFAHKGNFGRCLIIAGSPGMPGACTLASFAALKTGCGALTVWTDPSLLPVLHTSIPEVMSLPMDIEKFTEEVQSGIGSFDAVSIGPGLGVCEQTRRLLQAVLQNLHCPTVIDADALNLLSKSPGLLAKIHEKTILTPHRGEFRRLVGTWENELECIKKAKKFVDEHGCILILKGAHTVIFSPNQAVIYNSTGNPKMAIPGSGDVLSGILVALLGQGLRPEEAARVAVFKHGESGDLAVQDSPGAFLSATDLTRHLFFQN